MNTLLTALILNARAPGICEPWPLLVVTPAERMRHRLFDMYGCDPPQIELPPLTTSWDTPPSTPLEDIEHRLIFGSWAETPLPVIAIDTREKLNRHMGWNMTEAEWWGRFAGPPTVVIPFEDPPMPRIVVHKGRSVSMTVVDEGQWLRLLGPGIYENGNVRARAPNVAERSFADASDSQPPKWVTGDRNSDLMGALHYLEQQLRRPSPRPDLVVIDGVGYGKDDPLPPPFVEEIKAP